MRLLRAATATIGLLLASAAHAAPNLEGVWVIEKPQTQLTPADQKAVPFTAEGRTQFNQNKALAAKKDFSFDYTVSRCSSPGLPRMMLTAEPFKIIQRPDRIVTVFQWNQLIRQIDLRGLPPKPKPTDADFFIPTMMGDSTGHWEGDTLVAHTTGLSPDKLLDGRLPNSDQLEVTERFSLVDKDTLEDRITITDPVMYTQPWDVVVRYKHLADDVFPFAEDVCLDRKMAGKTTWPH